MKRLLTAQEFSKLIQTEGFVLKTQCQIEKDFRSCGFNFPETFTTEVLSQDDIIFYIENLLNMVLQKNRLTQLLYQIDLPEGVCTSILNEPDFSHQISQLILRREAYKIYLRSLF